MRAIDNLTELFTIGAGCVAVAAFFYGMAYYLPIWSAGFSRGDRFRGYGRKAALGFVTCVLAVVSVLVVNGALPGIEHASRDAAPVTSP